jgi:hypothetical protein
MPFSKKVMRHKNQGRCHFIPVIMTTAMVALDAKICLKGDQWLSMPLAVITPLMLLAHNASLRMRRAIQMTGISVQRIAIYAKQCISNYLHFIIANIIIPSMQ